MSDDPRGPYNPTWQNRRRVTFATLGFCLPALTAIAFFAPDTGPASTVASALGYVVIFLLGFYLIGPSLQGALLAKWNK